MLPMDGIVLAGGQSRRMGRSKEELLVLGTTLLERARRTLAAICAGTVWVSRPYGYVSKDSTDVPDPVPARGPLVGIAQGLAQTQQDLMAVLAVDLPNVTPALFEQLYTAWEACPTCDVVYARALGGRDQPLAAIWHRRATPRLNDALSSGQVPRVLDVIERLSTGVVETEPEVLFNLNTPEEWDAWRESGRQ